MIKITPAPWEAEEYEPRKWGVWNMENVCVAYCESVPEDQSEEANARLMAAAPEMYDALQSYVTCFECGYDDYDLYQAVKELLARIDGEADY